MAAKKKVAKKAAKKVAPKPVSPVDLPTPEEIMTLTRAELIQFIEWASSINSYDYYQALEQPDQIEFDALFRRAFRTERALRDLALAEFVSRAREQMPELAAAVAAVRKEMDESRRTADLLKDVSTFLNLLTPFLSL
jgi:hypothetical protein